VEKHHSRKQRMWDRPLQITQNFEYCQKHFSSIGAATAQPSVDVVEVKPAKSKERWQPKPRRQQTVPNPRCGRCGGQKHRDTAKCPAKVVTCHKCGKTNHFAKMCRTEQSKNKTVHQINLQLPSRDFFFRQRIFNRWHRYGE